MAIDWSRGYAASWRLVSVSPSWGDGEAVARLASADVKRDSTGDAPLLETATVHVDSDDPDAFAPGWYRLQMVAVQDGGSELVDVFTGLFEATGAELSDGVWDVELAGRSVLQPLKDAAMPTGTYTPAGADGAEWAADAVGRLTPAPVDVADDAGFAVGKTIVHDAGSTWLDAVWKVLRDASWQLSVNGHGDVSVEPSPQEPDVLLSQDDVRVLDDRVSDRLDASSVPNRYYAVDQDSGETAVAVNDSPASDVSHATRGRWVDEVDTSPQPRDGETLEEYARRKLVEASTVKRAVEYTRKWVPGLGVGRMVSTPRGTGTVTSQSCSCGAGIEIDETVTVEEELWNGE